MKAAKSLKLKKSYELAFSSSGSLLVTLARDVVGWDVETRSKRFRVHPFSHPASCAVHPNDSRIVVKNTMGRIVLLDAQDGALIHMFGDTKDCEGSNIVYSQCGEYVVDGSLSGVLTVRSSTSGQVSFRSVFPGEMITRITCTKDGDMWFVVHQPIAVSRDKPPAHPYISVWTWPFTSAVDYLVEQGIRIQALAVSPDSMYLCLVGYDNITIIRLADKKVMATTPYIFGGTGFVAAWSPDSQEIATVQKGAFVIYDASTLEKRQTIESQYPSDIEYAPDGRLLALGSWESGLLLERD